ncbi:MAG: SEL1-like repeat protein [Desulfobacterales bacterium]|nr:SEL1-like repeat protein [Desulfobacterales bacterium]
MESINKTMVISVINIIFLICCSVLSAQTTDDNFSQILIETIIKGAKEVNVNAQHELFRMYFRGEGVPKDVNKAFEWCSKAAEQGSAVDQAFLGLMYEKGIGVDSDYIQAYKWYNISIMLESNDKIKEYQDSLAKKMTTKQIDIADQLADEWLQNFTKDKELKKVTKKPEIKKNNKTKEAGLEKEQKKSKIKIGQSCKTEKLEITVISTEIKDSIGDEYFNTKPAEDAIYVAIKWKYKNITGKPINSFNQPNIKLLDPNGLKYNEDFEASSFYATEVNVTEKIISDLNPGITVMGAKVFEVSKESFNKSTWLILIEADKEVKVCFEG